MGTPHLRTAEQQRLPHAILRFRERYGRQLGIDELRALERRCEAGEGLLRCRHSHTEHGLLMDDDIAVLAVFRDGRIITFLPREAFTAGGRAAWRSASGPKPRKQGRPPKKARKLGAWK